MNLLKYHCKSALFGWPLRLMDQVSNASRCHDAPRVLVVRHPAKRSYTYRECLNWIRKNVPQLHARMEFLTLPNQPRDWDAIGLLACWTADTMRHWSPEGYRDACRLTDTCRARGIPVVNPVDSHAAHSKLEMTTIWRQSGIRAPRCELINDVEAFKETMAGMAFPFLIRDEQGHGRPSCWISCAKDLEHVPWHEMIRPMASEFIDTRSVRDGLFRKYRCIVAGDEVIPRHVIANTDWEVRPERRVNSDELHTEEVAFIQDRPEHADQLYYAAQLLDLDIAGIDYSIDPNGELVLWEANPVPNLNAPPTHRAQHILPAVERSFAAIAKLYLTKLGLIESHSSEVLTWSR